MFIPSKISNLKVIDLLKPCDRIGISVFENTAKEVFPVQYVKDKQSFINKINHIQARRGTALIDGMILAYEMMKTAQINLHEENKSEKREKRIIFLTDMGDMSREEPFFDLVKKASSENIFLTIVGIGYNLNDSSALKISLNKGANYFSATKEEHLEEYLVAEFDYNFFPCCFNAFLNYSSECFELVKTYGTDYKPEKNRIKTEWNINNHNLYDIQFRRTVEFLMLFYKRKNNRIPKPIIALLANFLNSSFSTVAEINTTTPSLLKVENGISNVKGGMILMKLRPKDMTNFECKKSDECNINFRYTDDRDCRQVYSRVYSYLIRNGDYFSNETIKKAISIYLGMKLLRTVLKYGKMSEQSNDRITENNIDIEDIEDMKNIENIKDIKNTENYETTKNIESIIDRTLKYLKTISTEEIFNSYNSEVMKLFDQIKKITNKKKSMK